MKFNLILIGVILSIQLVTAEGLYSGSTTDSTSSDTTSLDGLNSSLDEIGGTEIGNSTVGGLVAGDDTVGSIIGGTAGDVVDSFFSGGGISGIIDGILGNFGNFSRGIDNIFDKFNMGDMESLLAGDNALMGCLGQNIDLSGMLGGLCGLSQLGDGAKNIFSDPLAKCLIGDMGTISSKYIRQLEKLCGSPIGAGHVEYDADTNEWTSSDGYSNANEVKLTSESFTYYSAGLASASQSPELSGVKIGDRERKDSDNKYPNGKSVKDIYGTGGGVIAKEARENPTSSTALAWRSDDQDTLIMKDYASKMNKATGAKLLNENTFTLPPNQAKVIELNDELAKMIGDRGTINFHELQLDLVKGCREKYAADGEMKSAKTLSAYYKREKEVFKDFISSYTKVNKIRVLALKSLDIEYGNKIQLMKKDKNYMLDTSETRARSYPLEKRNRFRRMAIMQEIKRVEIKTELLRKKRELSENIDRVIARSYPASSLFRGDIAKKEIDEMLKAVDATIH